MSWNSRLVVPTMMRSASCSAVDLIWRPLTKVPLVEPKSVRIQAPDSSWRISACTRETLMSGMTMSFFDSRPMVSAWPGSVKARSLVMS